MVRGPSEGTGGCAGTRLTAVPCPRAPTLPVAAPQPGGSLGDTVTLRCHLPKPAAWVELYQDGLGSQCVRAACTARSVRQQWEWRSCVSMGECSCLFFS